VSLQSSYSHTQQTEIALPGPAGYEPAGLVRCCLSHWQTGTVPVSVSICSASVLARRVRTPGSVRAAGSFAATLDREGLLARTTRIRSELFGSLGATGYKETARGGLTVNIVEC
jgi:Serine dehydratase beta chain